MERVQGNPKQLARELFAAAYEGGYFDLEIGQNEWTSLKMVNCSFSGQSGRMSFTAYQDNRDETPVIIKFDGETVTFEVCE